MSSEGFELPEGLTRDIKSVPQWEFRCPKGDECSKGFKLLYKKPTRDECITAGAWHLYDKEKHAMDWQDALIAAEDGVTEGTKEYEVLLNEFGDEVPWPSEDKKGGKKKKKPSGNVSSATVAASHGDGDEAAGGAETEEVDHEERGRSVALSRRRRSASPTRSPPPRSPPPRTPPRDPHQRANMKRRSRSRGGVQLREGRLDVRGSARESLGDRPRELVRMPPSGHRQTRLPGRPRSPSPALDVVIHRAPRAHDYDITISRTELDSLIDDVGRAYNAASHAALFARKAATVFEDEARSIAECKSALERFRRF